MWKEVYELGSRAVRAQERASSSRAECTGARILRMSCRRESMDKLA